MGKMSKCITLLQTTLFRDQLIATRKRYRLERDERDLLRIFQSKPDDGADLVVIDAIHQRRYENNVDTRLVQIVDGTKLDVKQVSYLAMRIGIVADTVKLQVNKPQARLRSLAAKLF